MVSPHHPLKTGFSIINHPFWGVLPIFANIQHGKSTQILRQELQWWTQRSLKAAKEFRKISIRQPDKDDNRMDNNDKKVEPISNNFLRYDNI